MFLNGFTWFSHGPHMVFICFFCGFTWFYILLWSCYTTPPYINHFRAIRLSTVPPSRQCCHSQVRGASTDLVNSSIAAVVIHDISPAIVAILPDFHSMLAPWMRENGIPGIYRNSVGTWHDPFKRRRSSRWLTREKQIFLAKGNEQCILWKSWDMNGYDTTW